MSALLTDNLPLLAGAPNGIKKLRELILELAVRGKLVPQDPSDEPASELLKRIAEEKARLVAEGKIRKQKPLAAIEPNDQPFCLPSFWEFVRLGELIDPRRTITYGVLKPGAEDPNGVPLVKTENVQFNRILTDFKSRISLELDEEFKRTRLCGGEVLLTLVGSIGRCAIAPNELAGANLSRSVGMVVPVALVKKDFMVYAITALLNKDFIDENCAGTAQKVLNVGAVNDLVFPLPPLAEQHRIVAKVDELMALCDRLEARQADTESAHARLVQALLDSLTQANDATDLTTNWQRLNAHFHALFTTESSIDILKQTLLHLAVMGKLVPQDPSDEPASELAERIRAAKQSLLVEFKVRKQKELTADLLLTPPYEIPTGWEWQSIDDVLLVTGGVTLGRKLAGRELVAKPYLRVANVQRGHLDLNEIKGIEVPEDEVEKYLLRNGDLLITEGGDWDKVGRTAIWRDELPECLHQNHVFRARAVTTEWESRWAELYLNSAPAREYFAGSSKQTTNLASINMTQLRACAFPLPPLAEQHRIVAKLDQLMTLCDQLKTRLTTARQLHERLAGALVEQAVA